jgi:hypothetical protein
MPGARGRCHRRERVAAGLHGGHEATLAFLVAAQARDRGRGVAAGRLHPVDDPRVLLLDALDERGRLEQVGERLRVHHDRHESGLGRLIELYEALGQDATRLRQPRAQAGQPRALGAQRALHAVELRLVAVEVRLHLGVALAQRRELALQSRDRLAQPHDPARQRALPGTLLLRLRAQRPDRRVGDRGVEVRRGGAAQERREAGDSEEAATTYGPHRRATLAAKKRCSARWATACRLTS